MKTKTNKELKKVVLAYSGGLDTSIIVSWLKENYGCEVVCVVGNVGQGIDEEALTKKALASGASKIYIEDLTKEYLEDFAFPTLKAGAKYEGVYLLGTATARPIIAKRMIEIALQEEADAVCHGCTGKGNDQVRFELTFKTFAPDMPIIAPWRIWDIKSREEEMEYAAARNIPVGLTKETNYSKDENIWHLSHEGLDLEDPQNEPNYDKILELGVSPEKAPETPEYVTVDYVQGVPVGVNGEAMGAIELMKYLNAIAGKHGIGIDDIVENRLVGMKSRGVYENAGASILYKTHGILESLTLTKDVLHYKQKLGLEFADVVYNGKWFTPLREALSAFVDKSQENVTGSVKVKLYKGNIIHAGTVSPYSLYSEEYATFGEDGVYDQKDAEGFINLFGLPSVVYSKMQAKTLK